MKVNWHRFDGSECLYRDHHGRRVIADVEGAGYQIVLEGREQLYSVNLDSTISDVPAAFENGSLLVSRETGPCSVVIALGRSAPPSGEVVSFQDRYSGAGWVVSADNEFETDENSVSSPRPAVGICVPFYRQVSGSGRLDIIRAQESCERADGVAINDLEDLKSHGFKVQNMSAIFALSSKFEDGTTLDDFVASHLNAATFSFYVPESNVGLILRKRFDQFHGRQRARVFVDGSFAGWWYIARENRIHRWAYSEFGIAPELTNGKSTVQITIEPPAGVPLWSVSRLDLFALTP